jgi:hypothetical protein
MDSLEFKKGKVVGMDYKHSDTSIDNDEFVIEVGEGKINIAIKKISNFKKIWQGRAPSSLIGRTIGFKDGVMWIIEEIIR